MHLRSRFAIKANDCASLLAEAASLGLKSAMVISTCNRTELYGFAAHPIILGQLLVKYSAAGCIEDLQSKGYFLQGFEALHHVFRVGSGLDSQLIGDFEIAGQLKQAFAYSRQFAMAGPLLDRIVNFVLQASKRIKTETALSTGTVSVSYAAVEWLLKQKPQPQSKILVVGAGKFGASVIKNLLHYLPDCQVVVSNRTQQKALDLAGLLPAVSCMPFENIPALMDDFDVVVTCINAPEPLILSKYFVAEKKRFFIDLSVPLNIEYSVRQLPHCQLVNVDEISVILNKALERRRGEISKAEAIIAETVQAFYDWLHAYQHVPMVNDVKQKLLAWHNARPSGLSGAQCQPTEYGPHIEAAASNLMVNLKTRAEKGCEIISAYRDYFTLQNCAG